MDFNVANCAVVELFGMEIWITETMVNTWILMGILIALSVVARIRFRTYADVPKGLQNVLESAVEAFDGFLRGTGGDQLYYLGGWFFAIFSFIVLSNLSGLIPILMLRPPTADWTVTFGMALGTFFLIQVLALKYRGVDYLKGFFQPLFVFFPLNVLGELARPISLSFRLFGNILSGVILLGLVYGLAPVPARIVIPSFLHAYFDFAMGLLQAYIFTVLSIAFIGTTAGTAE